MSDSQETGNISSAAVEKATGRGWAAWIAVLDQAGAADWPHKQIAEWLVAETGVSAWWAQGVTVGYERAKGRRALGETAGAGFQVGVRRTVDAPPDLVWRVIASKDGVATWLGQTDGLVLAPGNEFRTREGSRGEIRVVKPGDRLRLTLREPGRHASSTLQITVATTPSGKTSFGFHHEKLENSRDRAAMREHWREVAERLVGLVRQAKTSLSPSAASGAALRFGGDGQSESGS